MSINWEQEFWNRNLSNLHQNTDSLERALNLRDREKALLELSKLQWIINQFRHSVTENLPTKEEIQRAKEKAKV